MSIAIPAELAELRVEIASLRPFARNPRRGDVELLKASLERHGQYRPIVVNRRTGEVLAGNHTLRAASELGWEQIAATYVDVDEEQAARIALVDNRSNDLAGYDDRMLADLLASLDGDLGATGFEPVDLERLLASLEATPGRDTEPGEVPEQPRTQLGDLWALGQHRLLCGDATDATSVERLLGGDEPVLIVTDPPYGVELDQSWRDGVYNDLGPAEPAGEHYMRSEGHRNLTINGDARADWSAAFEHAPSCNAIFVWHASVHACEVQVGLERIGFEVVQQIIWNKRLFAMSRSHYHWQHEPCWYARRRGARVPFYGKRNQSTMWDAESPKMIMSRSIEEKLDHPTQKPVVLFERPYENHAAPGEPVYEPFGGSGTAIIAAENLKRRCYAMEIDPAYCDVIVDRWERHTGREARRV